LASGRQRFRRHAFTSPWLIRFRFKIGRVDSKLINESGENPKNKKVEWGIGKGESTR